MAAPGNHPAGVDRAGLESRSRAWPIFIIALLSVLMLVMLGRVAQLQLDPGEKLLAATPSRASVRSDPAVRGDLMDRRGRMLSSTRFGHRVVIDPTLVPQPPDELIVRLAAATGMPEDELGAEVLAVLEENQSRAAALEAAGVGQEASATRAARLADAIESAERRLRGQGSPRDGQPPETQPPETQTPATQPPQALPAEPQPAAGQPPEAGSQPPAQAPATPAQPPGLVRYRVVSDVLSDERTAAVRAMLAERGPDRRRRFPGVMLEKRSVREPTGPEAAAIVGKVGFEQSGLIGAERMLEPLLKGRDGRVRYVRDAAGNPLWIEPGDVKPASAGADVRLSIDLEIQRIAFEELSRGVYDADAAGGRLVALDPMTGEIVAMVDIIRQDVADLQPFPWEPAAPAPGAARAPSARAGAPQVTPPAPPAEPLQPPVLDGSVRYVTIKPDPRREVHPALGRNRCVEDVYEPGSTFKPFVWATITELGLAQPGEVFDTEGGRWRTSYGREIQDVTRRDTMTWADVLVNSSNIGMIKGGERMSFRQLHDAVRRFGFGRPTGIGLPGEASGVVTPLRGWTKYSHTSVSFGYEIAVTPLQMVRAFAAFARPGSLAGTITPVRILAPQPAAPGEGVVYRVLPADVAKLTRLTMGGVTANMEARLAQHDESQSGWRYSIFGKSGTAKVSMSDPPEGMRRPKGVSGYFEQYNTSFIAGGPTEDPRLVCVVVIDDPGPELIRQRRHYGASTAGPVVRRVMERALAYMGVPISPRLPAADSVASGGAPPADEQ